MISVKKTVSALLAVAAFGVAAPAFADSDYRYYEQNRAQYISHDQAAKAALAHLGGGEVGEVEFDHDSFGTDHFDVEVYFRGMEYKVKVNAKTGKVLTSRIDD